MAFVHADFMGLSTNDHLPAPDNDNDNGNDNDNDILRNSENDDRGFSAKPGGA